MSFINVGSIWVLTPFPKVPHLKFKNFSLRSRWAGSVCVSFLVFFVDNLRYNKDDLAFRRLNFEAVFLKYIAEMSSVKRQILGIPRFVREASHAANSAVRV